jgi:hypothetical protein
VARGELVEDAAAELVEQALQIGGALDLAAAEWSSPGRYGRILIRSAICA